MAGIWLILLSVLILQLTLATFTARDAHSRGHDRDMWFILVLLFGIFAILIYLLTRNDSRLPKSDRPTKRTRSRLSAIVLYIAVALFGLALSMAVGYPVANAVYSDSLDWQACDSISVVDSPSPNDPCRVTENQYDMAKQAESNRQSLLTVSTLFFTAISVGGFHYWRNGQGE